MAAPATAPPAAGRRTVHRAWWVLVACCLMYGAVVGVIANTAGIYLHPVAEEMGTSLASLNVYLTIVLLVMTATMPVAGWVLARLRIEVTLAVAITLTTGTYAASALFHSLTAWYLAGVLLGIGFGFLLYVPVPLILNNWFARRNGLAIGLTAAFASLVAAFTNPIGGALIDAVGWRQTRAIMGGIGWVMAVPAVLLLVRFRPEDQGLRPYGADDEVGGIGTAGRATAVAGVSGAPAPAGEPAVSLRRAVRGLPFWCTVLLSGLFAFGASMLQQTPSHASAVGLDAATGASGVSAIMVGGILAKLALGQLHDRRGALPTTVVSAALGIVGPVVVIASGGHAAGFLVGCFLFGGGYAGLIVVPPLVARHFFGTADYSRIWALVTVAIGLFSAAAPVTYARIYDATGSFDHAWAACAAGFAVVVVLILVATTRTRRTDVHRPPAATRTEGALP